MGSVRNSPGIEHMTFGLMHQQPNPPPNISIQFSILLVLGSLLHRDIGKRKIHYWPKKRELGVITENTGTFIHQFADIVVLEIKCIAVFVKEVIHSEKLTPWGSGEGLLPLWKNGPSVSPADRKRRQKGAKK